MTLAPNFGLLLAIRYSTNAQSTRSTTFPTVCPVSIWRWAGGLCQRQHLADMEFQPALIDPIVALPHDIDLMLTSGGESAQLRGQHQFEADAQISEPGLGQRNGAGSIKCSVHGIDAATALKENAAVPLSC